MHTCIKNVCMIMYVKYTCGYRGYLANMCASNTEQKCKKGPCRYSSVERHFTILH